LDVLLSVAAVAASLFFFERVLGMPTRPAWVARTVQAARSPQLAVSVLSGSRGVVGAGLQHLMMARPRDDG
jgi:hypothetical protein